MVARDDREKQLLLALRRIQLGRGKIVSPGRKLSILAVAQEAQIDPSTIHTRYPLIAQRIRELCHAPAKVVAGASDIEKLRRLLAAERANSRDLRRSLANVVSLHQAALLELIALRAQIPSEGKPSIVTSISKKLRPPKNI